MSDAQAAHDEKAVTGASGSAKSDAHENVQSVGAYDAKPTPGLLRVKIYTPFKTFYEGDARSVSAVNDTGSFDILPTHHNFITMLRPCDVKVETPKKEEKIIPIARGLMHVKEDKLIIFLDV